TQEAIVDHRTIVSFFTCQLVWVNRYFQGVLVKEKDLENTLYDFTLDDGSVISVKGNEEIEYDGELHTAANLYDALKEGYYGKF
ncbi:hypothetical protein, partial [Aeromonas veronii]